MTCTEEQFRSALRTVAADFTEASLPPLELPDDQPGRPPRMRAEATRRRWGRWLVPLTAAAAVTAIAVTATVIGGASTASHPGQAASGLWHGVPRYYLIEPGGAGANMTEAFVRETSSGATLASARSPHGCRFARAAAASDDRTFLLACNVLTKSGHGTQEARLFLARFDPVGDRLAVTALRLPLIRDIHSIALSPDGTTVAVMSVDLDTGSVTLRVFSIASGSVRTWTGTVGIGGYMGGLSWGPGSLLAFVYFSAADLHANGIRLLDTNAQPGSLAGASRLAVSAEGLPDGYQAMGTVTVSGNGATLATVLSGQRGDPASAEFAEFSAATGRLLRRWLPSTFPYAAVLWSDFTGRTLVASATTSRVLLIPHLGILTSGRFTPLPHSPGPADLDPIGWPFFIDIAF